MSNSEQKNQLDALKKKYPEDLPTLVGVDGNAFSIMGHFRNNARRSGWEADDIQQVLKIAQSGNYNHLLATIAHFTD